MIPWSEIQFGYEVLGTPLEALSSEYEVSMAELKYAAETWKPVDQKDLQKISKDKREQLEPQYALLEQMFVEKVKLTLSTMDLRDGSAPDRLKKLTECYKSLRFGDKEQQRNGDVVVNIINSFGDKTDSPRNVTKATVSAAPPEPIMVE